MKKDKDFIKKPAYEGGPKAMRAFIGKNLSYPQEALTEKVEGTVVLKYSIDYQGNVVDAKVISGLGYGCDEEAIRLVRLLKFEVPKNRGVKVLFHKDIKIHFRLPKQPAVKAKTPARPMQYSYTVTAKKKEGQKRPSEEEKGGGYSYTISF